MFFDSKLGLLFYNFTFEILNCSFFSQSFIFVFFVFVFCFCTNTIRYFTLNLQITTPLANSQRFQAELRRVSAMAADGPSAAGTLPCCQCQWQREQQRPGQELWQVRLDLRRTTLLTMILVAHFDAACRFLSFRLLPCTMLTIYMICRLSRHASRGQGSTQKNTTALRTTWGSRADFTKHMHTLLVS